MRVSMLAMLVIALGVLAVLFPPLQDLVEDADLSWLFAARGTRPAPEDVVVVSIDKASAAELNVPEEPHRWPRRLHAQLIDRMHAAGARVIGFDLIFKAPQTPVDDSALADAIRRAGNVVLFSYLGIQTHGGARVERVVEPLPMLRDAARTTAIFPLPKYPKRVNQFWVRKTGAGDVPTFPSTMLREFAPDLFSALRIPDSVYINFYGPARSVRTVPFVRALLDAPPQLFAGKAVFVGLSEPMQTDQLDTFHTVYSQPDGSDLSGVEIGATAFANLREGSWLRPTGFGASLAVIIAWGLVITLLCQVFSTLHSVAVVVIAGAVYFGLAVLLFANEFVSLPLFVPLVVQAPVALFGTTMARYLVENREKRKVRDALQRYLPAAVIDDIADDIAHGRQTQHLVHGACVATDAQSYTALSERMSPQSLGQFMNRYYGVLFPVVRQYDGFVSDVVGDAMLALWTSLNVPDAHRRAQACRAALHMARAVDEFNRTQPMPLPTRFGIHAGEMALGNVGTGDHYEYRAVGDMVNTTSRVQGLNKLLGTRVLATAEALRDVDGLLVRPFGAFRLAGKSQLVEIFELVAEDGVASDSDRQHCERFASARALFNTGEWARARDEFQVVAENYPEDGAAKYFRDVSSRYLVTPPSANWDGAIEVDAK